MTRRLVLALAAFAVLLVPVQAGAWSFYAHRKTAEIALANVSPEVRAKIRALLVHAKDLGTPQCPIRNLEDAAVWADCIRAEGWRWGYTGAWHYRTAPICKAFDPRANCAGGNCVTAQITRTHRILADESLPPAVRLEALAFMVHFAGDVHNPLHSGDNEDQGGNQVKADYGIKPGYSLHAIWDNPLAERAISDPADPVARRYTAEERKTLAGGTPDDWGRESWEIARSLVYPTAFDTDDVCARPLPERTALSQEDIVRAVPIARQRVVQAGLRIADLLDSAFKAGPLVPDEPRRRR
jgi:hypothetical protein